MCFRTAFVDADGTIETAQTSGLTQDTRRMIMCRMFRLRFQKQSEQIECGKFLPISLKIVHAACVTLSVQKSRCVPCHSFARGHMAHWTALLEDRLEFSGSKNLHLADFDATGPGSPSTCCLHSLWTDSLRSPFAESFDVILSSYVVKGLNFYNCALTISAKPWIQAITGHGGAEARALKMVWDLAA